MLASTTKLLSNPLKQIVGPSTCRALTQANDISLAHQLDPQRGISTQDNAPPTTEQSYNVPASSVGAYFDQFHNYCHMIEDAKAQARRSILVDHCGLHYIDFSSEFHNVERVYAINKETRGGGISRLSLIEFKSESDADLVSKQARHNLGFLPVPLKILRYQSNSSAESYDKQNLPFPVNNASLSYRRELATNFKTYTELIANNTMTQVDFKMRFITLVNFERVLCAGLFQEYELMPFGSSVIDIGRDFGDLDIVLTRKANHYEFIQEFLSNPENSPRRRISATKPTTSEFLFSKLVHLDKSLFSETRDNSGIRGAMRWFDYVLKEYMPLTEGYNVLFLRHAKVPIIKFTSLVTSLDCDLSFNFALDHRQHDVLSTNYSGIIMSQLLYSICRNNNLFSAVIVYLRIFAKLTNITSKEPNVGWTNFQFLSLVLFYLQRISVQPVKNFSPSTATTNKEATNQSTHHHQPEYTIETVHSPKQSPLVLPFRYLLDSRKMSKLSTNLYKFTDDQLNELIPQVVVGFFEFYSKHDFSLKALNLFEAQIDRKLDNSPVYVTNPLDRTRNICHNVNRKGLDNLMQQVKAAAVLVTEAEQDPLSLIRTLLIKYNQQRSSSIRLNTYDFRQEKNVTSQEIARDVFR